MSPGHNCAQYFQSAAVNVLALQPCFVGAVPEARVHVGSTTTIVPLVAGTPVHLNISMAVLGVPAMGLLTTSDVLKNAATAVSMDVILAIADGVVAAAIVSPMV